MFCRVVELVKLIVLIFFIVLTLYCLGFPYIASLAKNFISISEVVIKKFSYGRRDYIYICVCELIGRRKEPILFYIPKYDEKKNSGSKGLSILGL